MTPIARIRSRSESTSTSLSLNIRTADGDTVELSFDATSLKQTETGKLQTSAGKAAYSRTSQSDSFNFSAKVSGDLNDQELADIGSLLQSLQSGEPSESSPSSLDSYTGSFSQTTSISNETFRLYG
ncbi:MAG: hypothetical protein ABI806_05485 [Candidatus Solibacter sp.]